MVVKVPASIGSIARMQKYFVTNRQRDVLKAYESVTIAEARFRLLR